MRDRISALEEFEARKPRRGLRDEKQIRYSTRLGRPEYHRDLKSKKPQAVLKVIRFGRGANMKKVLNYISQEKEQQPGLKLEDHNGIKFSGSESFETLYKNWAREFERKKPGSKRSPRHFAHVILSADTDLASSKKVEEAARSFLRTHLGDEGYEYAFVTHTDREKPHVHVLIKLRNHRTGRKLHFSKAATFDMRREWGRALEAQGIEHVATLRRDRTQVLENVARGIERIKERPGWHASVMKRSSSLSLQQRMQMTTRIVYMKKMLKKATLPLESTRRKYMKELRELDGRIRSGDPAHISAAAKRSISTIGHDIHQLKSLLSEMAVPARETQTLGISRKKIARQSTHLAVAASRDIRNAMQFVRESTDLTRAQKKDIVKQLRPLAVAAENAFGVARVKLPDRGREFQLDR